MRGKTLQSSAGQRNVPVLAAKWGRAFDSGKTSHPPRLIQRRGKRIMALKLATTREPREVQPTRPVPKTVGTAACLDGHATDLGAL